MIVKILRKVIWKIAGNLSFPTACKKTAISFFPQDANENCYLPFFTGCARELPLPTRFPRFPRAAHENFYSSPLSVRIKSEEKDKWCCRTVREAFYLLQSP